MNLRQMTLFAALLGAALFVSSMLTRPAFADEPLVGTWKLVSLVNDDLETKEQWHGFGQHPGGLLIFTPQKRFMVLQTAEERKGSQSEAERAKAFATMFAMAGTYRVEGSKYFVTVELSWDPTYVGMELARDFKIEGNRLTSIAAPRRGTQTGRMMVATSVWERVTQ